MSELPTSPPEPLDPKKLSERDVLEMLDKIEGALPTRRIADLPLIKKGTALIVGDTHGDWPIVRSLVERYLEGSDPVDQFVMLGDYVDRSPQGIRHGSVVNALYVLSLAKAYPDRFIALRGNHEAFRCLRFVEHTLDEDARQCWGSVRVGERLEDLFDLLPLAAMTENGAYIAHAGFPMAGQWRDEILHPTTKTWLELLWNDVDVSPTCGQRGIDQAPITERNLQAFFTRSGANVFIRGHDPEVAGRLLYGDKLLTVHTTRAYGTTGLCAARIPLDRKLKELSKGNLLEVRPPQLCRL
jgi:hypothetical protein